MNIRQFPFGSYYYRKYSCFALQLSPVDSRGNLDVLKEPWYDLHYVVTVECRLFLYHHVFVGIVLEIRYGGGNCREKVLQPVSPSFGRATPPTKVGDAGVVDSVRMQYRREKALQPVSPSFGRATPPTKVGNVGVVDRVRMQYCREKVL